MRAFREALFLDADCFVAADPSFLFDEPEYVSTGARFWPDLPPSPPRREWVPAAASVTAPSMKFNVAAWVRLGGLTTLAWVPAGRKVL